MIQQVKTVSKETLIYGLGSAAGSIVAFFLIPLYTKFLAPDEYGYLAVLTVVQTLVEITAVFGLGSGLFRYYLMADSADERQVVLMTCLWLEGVAILIVGGLTLPFSAPLSRALFGTSELSRNLAFAILSGLFSASGSLFYAMLRAQQKSVRFAVLQVVKIVLLASTNIYFVAVLRWNYSGIVVGNMIVYMLLAVLVPLSFIQDLRFSFSTKYVPRLLRFVFPIFLVNVFFYVLNLSDRFFLNHYTTPKEVGIYSLGYKLGTAVMTLLISPFSTAIVPYALSIAREDHFPRTFAKIIKYFLLLITYVSLGIFLFSPEIIVIVSNPQYLEASRVVGLILLSSIFYGLDHSVGIAIDIVEKTHLATVIVFCGAATSLAINFVAVPRLGMIGSALASCVSNGLLLLMMFTTAQKHLPLKYEVGAFVKLAAVVAVVVGFTLVLQSYNLDRWIEAIVKACVYALVPLVFVGWGILDADERHYLVQTLNKVGIRVGRP